MNTDIAANIRRYRKERRLTQEQLAEVLGVTVGAVSKWEAGASVPDIGLILDMASFFELSVDTLLGYEKQSGSLSKTLETIRALRNGKDFEGASLEAERALIKYPNNFDVAFCSAVMYSIKGVELHDNRAWRRALALYDRALELIAQNTDEMINEWTIKNDIASVKACMGNMDEALEALKQNNAAGLNNGSIGYLLAEKKPEEALPYLSHAMIDHTTELLRVIFGLCRAYSAQKRYDEGIAACLWMRDVIDGLCVKGANSHLDKEIVELYAACMATAAEKGDVDAARTYMLRARERAKQFDAAPANDFSKSRFYHAEKSGTAFDDFGATAMAGIKKTMDENPSAAKLLMDEWNALEAGGR